MRFNENGDRVCPYCTDPVPGNLGQYNRHLVNVHEAHPTSGDKDQYRDPAAPPARPVADATLHARVSTVERRVDIVEAQGTEPLSGGMPAATDFLSQQRGSPGFVVDEAVARETPCVGYALKGGDKADLVFSRGIVGALDTEQRTAYCQRGTELHDLTPKQRERLTAFNEAASACKTEQKAEALQGDPVRSISEGGVETWLSCMSRELRTRGQRL